VLERGVALPFVTGVEVPDFFAAAFAARSAFRFCFAKEDISVEVSYLKEEGEEDEDVVEGWEISWISLFYMTE